MSRGAIEPEVVPSESKALSAKERAAELLKLRRKELSLIRKQRAMEDRLPHLFMPMYTWQRQIVDSANKINLLTAANQIGKSTALIRRAIANCTDPARWDRLWGKGVKPTQFWYFYPDFQTVEKELEHKWLKEWLPRNGMEMDPQYGWKLASLNSSSKRLPVLRFNAGPIIYFQTYTKRISTLQAGSIYEVFADEELPEAFYDELIFRLTATSGYFTSGFTPTLNQDFWREIMEGGNLPSALKLTVSMYDCLKYDDGTPSRVMTLEKIKLAEERCKNELERQRRIFGRFITDEGRYFYAFDYTKNVVPKYDIAKWLIYAGVDYGSGDDAGSMAKKSRKNHPSAIVYLAVRPDFQKGVVFRTWRGDFHKTTAGDLFEMYQKTSYDLNITQGAYDFSAPDFGTIAQRNGVPFQRANKARDTGEDLINTLFKFNMLDIFEGESENHKLVGELNKITVANQRSDKRGDDLADALRFAVMLVNWDMTVVDTYRESVADRLSRGRKKRGPSQEELEIMMRRGEDVSRYFQQEEASDEQVGWGVEDELQYWNREYSGN